MDINNEASRRRFLQVATTAGLLGTAGCNTTTSNSTTISTTTPTPTQTPTPRPTESPTETTPASRNTIFVAPDGSNNNRGTKAAPVGTIQEALDRARPGQMIHVKSGQYFESLKTVRSGTSSNPITITGPPDAIIAGDTESHRGRGLLIRHSHIYLTGLTFDGLHDSANSDELKSYYMGSAIGAFPSGDEYLKDLVIKPHRIGNTIGSQIHILYSENVEIGEFRVIGPAGLNYLLTDKEGHWGEIVYLGLPVDGSPNAFEQPEPIDKTHNVHIHHIDNSEGHAHSEIVNPKYGTYDVLVEYCTDGGGSQDAHPNNPAASINLQSPGTTVRWCDLRNGLGEGIALAPVPSEHMVPENAERPPATGGAIYGNSVTGFDDKALAIYDEIEIGTTPDSQWLICGNTFDGPTDGTPDAACDESVPTTNEIGHTGGDSPW